MVLMLDLWASAYPETVMPRRNQRTALPIPETTVFDLQRTSSKSLSPRQPSLLTGRERLHPAHRARLEREDALAALTECAMPLCTSSPAVDHNGRNLGVCHSCMLPLAVYLDQVKEHEDFQPAAEVRIKREHKRIREEQVARRRQDTRAITPGWIYYIRVTDRIKIGYSTDVRNRMRAYPPHSELLAVHPGTPTLERDMHAQFAGLLAQGREWFREGDELTDHIVKVVKDFGPPPKDMVYKFREGTTQRIKPRARR